MDERQKQVAVWLALPLVGLLLMVAVLGAWGGVYIIAPIALLLGVAVVVYMVTSRRSKDRH